MSTVQLSQLEREQLGSLRLRQDGKPSTHPYPEASQWPAIRALLLARSMKANPQLEPELTAYTPGETEALLQHPTVRAWHQEMREFRVPASFQRIILVPCAKTKPWTGPGVTRSPLYSAYNRLREEMPESFFLTVSEPLGVVPMSRWASFPQYDNPGLFADDALQGGMSKKEWEASPFRRWYGLPFDRAARARCLELLGEQLGLFLQRHRELEIISLLDSREGPASTHGLMLDHASRLSGLWPARHPKRGAPRINPEAYLRQVLQSGA